MEAAASGTEKAQDKVENLTDAMQKLREEAEKLGHGTWGIDEINQVISQNTVSQNDKMLTVLKELESKIADRKKRLEDESILLRSAEESKKDVAKWIVFGGEPIKNWDYDKDREYWQGIIDQHEQNVENIKNETDQGLVDVMTGMFNSIIESEKSEIDKLREQVDLVNASIAAGVDPDGKASRSVQILEKKIQNITDAESQKLVQPLESFMKEVQKTEKQFAWMNDITADMIEVMTDEQYAAWQAAEAEWKKAMKQAKLFDKLGESTYKLYKQIQSYKDPYKEYIEVQKQLTALQKVKGMSVQGWIAASKKSEEALLASSKYGSLWKQAEENAKTYEQKRAEMVFELVQQAKATKKSREQLKAAIALGEEALLKEEMTRKADSVVNRDLRAAEAGSLEAYKIINNNREDRTVTAIKEQTKLTLEQTKALATIALEATAGWQWVKQQASGFLNPFFSVDTLP